MHARSRPVLASGAREADTVRGPARDGRCSCLAMRDSAREADLVRGPACDVSPLEMGCYKTYLVRHNDELQRNAQKVRLTQAFKNKEKASTQQLVHSANLLQALVSALHNNG